MKNKITKCNKWLVGLALVASIAFSGCGGSMPKCDDKEVLDLVTQLIQKQWLQTPFLCGTAEGNHDLFDNKESSYNEELHKLGYKNRRAYCEARKYDYSAFMINSADKETKKISCKAKLHIKSPHTEILSPLVEKEAFELFGLASALSGVMRFTTGKGMNGSEFSIYEQLAEITKDKEYFIKYTAQATQDGQVYVEVLGYE